MQELGALRRHQDGHLLHLPHLWLSARPAVPLQRGQPSQGEAERGPAVLQGTGLRRTVPRVTAVTVGEWYGLVIGRAESVVRVNGATIMSAAGCHPEVRLNPSHDSWPGLKTSNELQVGSVLYRVWCR